METRRYTLQNIRQLTDRGKQVFVEEVRHFTGKIRIQQRYIDIILQGIKEQTILEGNLARQYID
jgi:hypothetical protein